MCCRSWNTSLLQGHWETLAISNIRMTCCSEHSVHICSRVDRNASCYMQGFPNQPDAIGNLSWRSLLEKQRLCLKTPCGRGHILVPLFQLVIVKFVQHLGQSLRFKSLWDLAVAQVPWQLGTRVRNITCDISTFHIRILLSFYQAAHSRGGKLAKWRVERGIIS